MTFIMQNKYVINVAEPDITNLEIDYLMVAIKNNEILFMGNFVNQFKKSFSDFCEAPYASACMNGTVALHLALIGSNIKPGDEAIVAALAYVTTANAAVHIGEKPVFADVHVDHWGKKII